MKVRKAKYHYLKSVHVLLVTGALLIFIYTDIGSLDFVLLSKITRAQELNEIFIFQKIKL